MIRWSALAVLLACAAAAEAAPVLHRVESAVVKGRRLDLTIEASVDAAGEVVVEGDVNGVPVLVRKKLAPGRTRTLRIKLDAKRHGQKALATALRFDVDVTARETGGAQVSQSVQATVPVPCVVLEGFDFTGLGGPGGGAAIAAALAPGGGYVLDGKRPTMVAYDYASLDESLAGLGKGLGRTVQKTLRGTCFGKVDLVGYSYGGLVARAYLAQGGDARVRQCVFVASPNEGLPLAYLGVGLVESGLIDDIAAQDPAVQLLIDQFAALATPELRQALRNMFPTYPWVTPAFGQSIVEAVLGDGSTPLSALNDRAPPAGVVFEAYFYTSVPGGQIGTVEVVDLDALTALQQGQQLDPAAIANGAGDGLVPARSVRMDDQPLWSSAIVAHDMGEGTHAGIVADPDVLAGIAAILAR